MCSEGVCYRTEVAACMTYMTRRDWRNYVLGRSTRGVKAAKSEAVIRNWIDCYIAESVMVIACLDRRISSKSLNDADRAKLVLLSKRWGQIRELCQKALESVS